MTINIKNVSCNILRTGEEELKENLKFRAITNTGFSICFFPQTRGYKMIKKEKKCTKRKRQRNVKKVSSGKFLFYQLYMPLALQLLMGATVCDTQHSFLNGLWSCLKKLFLSHSRTLGFSIRAPWPCVIVSRLTQGQCPVFQLVVATSELSFSNCVMFPLPSHSKPWEVIFNCQWF